MGSCTITFASGNQVRYEADQQRFTYGFRQDALRLQTVQWLAHLLAASPRDAQQWNFLKVVGQNLFELMFPTDTDGGRCARDSFVRLAQQGYLSVDLQFDAEAGLLGGLPWEFLYVPANPAEGTGGFFLAAEDKHISLSRRLRDLAPSGGRPESLRVLVAVSNPPSQRPEVQSKELREFLALLKKSCGNKIACEFVEDSDWESLQDRISRFQPDVFHFRGHGEQAGLWLTAPPEMVEAVRKQVRDAHERGDFSPETFDAGELIGKDDVIGLFKNHRPRLVILEACYSGAPESPEGTVHPSIENLYVPRIARALLNHVPAIVAMQYTIHVQAAEKFVHELYQGIVQGHDLDEAVGHARAQLTRSRGNKAAFANRSFGAPVVYLGGSGPLCNRLLGHVLLRCPSCFMDVVPRKTGDVPNFCVECGRQVHIRCAAESCGQVNAVTDPAHPPAQCHACSAPLPRGYPGRLSDAATFA